MADDVPPAPPPAAFVFRNSPSPPPAPRAGFARENVWIHRRAPPPVERLPPRAKIHEHRPASGPSRQRAQSFQFPEFINVREGQERTRDRVRNRHDRGQEEEDDEEWEEQVYEAYHKHREPSRNPRVRIHRSNSPVIEDVTRLPTFFSRPQESDVVHLDPEGDYFTTRRSREAHPSAENARNTTSKYYEGGMGENAWDRKKMQRANPRSAPIIHPDWEAPEIARIQCFVTIRGRPVFADPDGVFECWHHDPWLKEFLEAEYRKIVRKTSWCGHGCFHLKTIGAVEFQTWTKRENSRWELSEVDSIPEKATRSNMSHFSYQLRHTYEKASQWAEKVEKLLILADRVHTNAETHGVWNLRIHIIEIIDARAIYLLLGAAIVVSTAAGLIYGTLRKNDFGSGFTIAGFVVTCIALIIAVVAAADFIGMETPDSFAATDVYVKGMTVANPDFTPGPN